MLRLLVDSKTDREIAEELFISPRTASKHVGAILVKFDVGSRGEAAVHAAATRWSERRRISPPDLPTPTLSTRAAIGLDRGPRRSARPGLPRATTHRGHFLRSPRGGRPPMPRAGSPPYVYPLFKAPSIRRGMRNRTRTLCPVSLLDHPVVWDPGRIAMSMDDERWRSAADRQEGSPMQNFFFIETEVAHRRARVAARGRGRGAACPGAPAERTAGLVAIGAP